MSGDAWLVVGLGNPGSEYAETRHSAGQLVVAELARSDGLRFGRHRRAHAEIATVRVGGQRVELLRSLGYMNESGGPVATALAYEKLTPGQLVVVHDDLDLDFGQVRLKLGGGDAGHNGLKSIRRSLGTGEFYRVRVGIGRPPGRQDPAEYVLRRFNAAQRAELPAIIGVAVTATVKLITDGLAATQQEYHSG